MTKEEPVIIKELRKEIASLKDRLEVCEDALREVIECYQRLESTSKSS